MSLTVEIQIGYHEYRKGGHRASKTGCLARHQRKALPGTEIQLDGKARTGILESQDLVGIELSARRTGHRIQGDM